MSFHSTMPLVINQHYVPRFYLKQFAPDSEHVPTFFMDSEKIATPHVTALACERGFYDVADLNKRAVELGCPEPQIFEAFYGNEERVANDTIAKIAMRFSNGDLSPISKAEVAALGSVLLTQHLRTRRARDGAEERKISELYAQMSADGVFEEFTQDLDFRLSKDGRKKEHLIKALDENFVNKSFLRLIRMGWVALLPPDRKTFNSSDHPAVMKFFDAPKPGALFYYPLTPNLAVAVGENIRAPLGIGVKGVQRVTQRQLHYLNSIQAKGCTNQVYSIDSDFTAARAARTQNRHLIG